MAAVGQRIGWGAHPPAPLRALLLSLLVVTAASAQGVEEVWVSAAPGAIVAAEGNAFDELYGTLALQGARGGWTGRASYSETASLFWTDASGGVAMARAGDLSDAAGPGRRDPTRFRTLHLAAGPRASADGGTVALVAGPALTWGGLQGGGSYRELGLGVAGQALLHLGGTPLWVGGEVSGVLNAGASHAGLVGVLRVDLVRRAR